VAASIKPKTAAKRSAKKKTSLNKTRQPPLLAVGINKPLSGRAVLAGSSPQKAGFLVQYIIGQSPWLRLVLIMTAQGFIYPSLQVRKGG
jgi:hypothetical protein